MNVSLNGMLTLSAEELLDLAVTADQLGTVEYGDIERWQALDRLSQHLGGVATILKHLADVAPAVTLDVSTVLDQLNTAALADRLAGHTVQAEGQTGGLELFEA